MVLEEILWGASWHWAIASVRIFLTINELIPVFCAWFCICLLSLLFVTLACLLLCLICSNLGLLFMLLQLMRNIRRFEYEQSTTSVADLRAAVRFKNSIIVVLM